MTKLIGLPSLKAKLIRLPQAAIAKISGAMEQAAQEIVDLMKNLVAKDSGALRDSIGWTWGKAPKGSISVATVSARNGDMTITIFAGNDKAYYARWVEFGTKKHVNAGKFAGTENPGTAARPFFFVSFRAGKKSAKALVRKAVRDSARQVANS